MKIHFATGVRTPEYFCFKYGTVWRVEAITIDPIQRQVFVGGVQLLPVQIVDLSWNDGFDTVEEFWEWFNKPFSGVLIHWVGHEQVMYLKGKTMRVGGENDCFQ